MCFKVSVDNAIFLVAQSKNFGVILFFFFFLVTPDIQFINKTCWFLLKIKWEALFCHLHYCHPSLSHQQLTGLPASATPPHPMSLSLFSAPVILSKWKSGQVCFAQNLVMTSILVKNRSLQDPSDPDPALFLSSLQQPLAHTTPATVLFPCCLFLIYAKYSSVVGHCSSCSFCQEGSFGNLCGQNSHLLQGFAWISSHWGLMNCLF